MTGAYRAPEQLAAHHDVSAFACRSSEQTGWARHCSRTVFARLLAISDDIGCRGLLVHAESVEARDFYLHLVSELEPIRADDLHLVVLMKGVRRTLGR